MGPDALQAVVQIGAERFEQFPLRVGEPVARRFEFLPQFLQQLRGRLGVIEHEIQRVADLVRDAGGQLSEPRELFARDDLILRPAQFLERVLELAVLGAQFLRQLLHQVEALDLQRVAAEDLQRRRHVRHFVAAVDPHRALEVAGRHGQHAVGQPLQARQQQPADEQPRDQHGRHDAETIDGDQQRPSRADRILGSGGGGDRAVPRRANQLLDGLEQSRRDAAVLAQQDLLTLSQRDPLGAQFEHAAGREAQVAQASDRGRGPRHAVDQVLEVRPERSQGGARRDAQGVVEQLDGQGAVPRHRRQLGLDGRHPLAQGRGPRPQREPLIGGALQGVQVGDQTPARDPHAVEALATVAGQRRQPGLERLPLRTDAGLDLRKLLRGRRAHEARRRDGERRPPLGDGERSGQLRQARFVHLRLRVADAVECEPRHQARDEGERHGAADAGVESRRDAGERPRGALDPAGSGGPLRDTAVCDGGAVPDPGQHLEQRCRLLFARCPVHRPLPTSPGPSPWSPPPDVRTGAAACADPAGR